MISLLEVDEIKHHYHTKGPKLFIFLYICLKPLALTLLSFGTNSSVKEGEDREAAGKYSSDYSAWTWDIDLGGSRLSVSVAGIEINIGRVDKESLILATQVRIRISISFQDSAERNRERMRGKERCSEFQHMAMSLQIPLLSY